MDCSMPSLPVHHQLPEPAQTHVLRVSDAIQPSHSKIVLTEDPSIPLLGIHPEKYYDDKSFPSVIQKDTFTPMFTADNTQDMEAP